MLCSSECSDGGNEDSIPEMHVEAGRAQLHDQGVVLATLIP